MSKSKLRLTDLKVKKATPPETGRIELRDTQVPGLVLRVTSKGAKSWGIRYRAGKTQRRLTLGVYPAMSLSEAREEALDAIRDTKRGQDLQREKAKARTATAPKTLKETIEDFIEGYAKPKNRSWKEVENLFANEVKPVLGKRPLEDVARADLIELLDKIKAPHSANKTFRYLGRFFRWCLEKDRIPENPMMGITLPRPEAEISRDRILSDAEIVELWDTWVTIGDPFGNILRLLLILGQRRDEVGRMRWSDLNLEEGIWTIPREFTKADRTHVVPLPPLALEIITATPKIDKCDWLFSTTGKTPVSGYSKAKARSDRQVNAAREENELAPITPWRIHDIRRTVASGLARLRVPQIVVEKIQNRRTGEGAGVAGVYNRYSYLDERKAAMEAWARQIEALVNPDSKTGDVLEFQARTK